MINIWELTKNKVDDLSSNYTEVIQQTQSVCGVHRLLNEKIKVDGEDKWEINEDGVRYSKSGKLTRIQIYLPKINDYTVTLIAYLTKDKETKEAWYVAFNNETNMAYKRDLNKKIFEKNVKKYLTYK